MSFLNNQIKGALGLRFQVGEWAQLNL
jgi:hypothetical protein